MQSFLPKTWVRSLCVIVASLAMACSAASAASAATTHIYTGGLSAGRSFGIGERHTNPSYARVSSDHTACGGFDVTMDGYAYRAPDYFALSTCGAGTATYAPGYNVGLVHGVVFNPNSSTTDTISNSFYAW